ncbi:NAD(P)-dependent oxidoreductase [Microlunatus parietis]|uniref:3-hydroxyisobutyrate dehydrogenase-like beta-hydroxyacid dehydrogenase n=1 Tax=Microlunatus parietis TaxID=682979 RepID=A0A7Y9IAM5_9ACTN|nr:NAD(P)-binding domain-containing protein [Microlunatus parietis]NYE73165.1 3-hydroxyisobutyrate dehydrogenase-like beta-hydroxyacid dehydrogenase [Microlunatus parietis]
MINTTTSVSVLGLGLMGHALAETLLAAGHPTTVWNRTASKADRLVEAGATLAGSATAAAHASPLVIICVTDPAAVREILDQQDGTLDGTVVINLTSGPSSAATEFVGWAERHGVEFLDGAILASPEMIGTADTTIIYSGPRAAFDRHAETLGRLGTAIHVGDDHRQAALLEMAGLGLMWGALNGYLHGAALIGAAGVDAATFAPLAAATLRAVADWLPGYAKQIDDGEYPALDGTLDIHLAAMNHLLTESETLGLNLDLPRYVKSVADRGAADGKGQQGYAVLVEQFANPA